MNYRLTRSSSKDFLKFLEEDIQRANALAAAIPRAKHDSYLQMKLVYNQLAPLFLFLLQWVDCSCSLLPRYLNFFHILIYKVQSNGRPITSTHGRKATIHDFYAVILPSLQRLQSNFEELENGEEGLVESGVSSERRVQESDGKLSNVDLEREDECGICLESSTKMVFPNCCHSMCIKCYHNWNKKSESCPFCRGSLRRVKSEELWVLTCGEDVVDAEMVSKEELWRFYLYVSSLPKEYPDALFLLYYEYLI